MSFAERLNDLAPSDSLEQVITDQSVKMMALISLLIKCGVFSEQEFQRERVRCDRYIEEERTKRIDARAKSIKELRLQQMQRIYEAARAALQAQDPEAIVDIFRGDSPDIQQQVGTLMLRAISKLFHNRNYQSRLTFLTPVIMPLCRELEEYVTMLLISPEELPGSVASLQFDTIVASQGCVELTEPSDPC